MQQSETKFDHLLRSLAWKRRGPYNKLAFGTPHSVSSDCCCNLCLCCCSCCSSSLPVDTADCWTLHQLPVVQLSCLLFSQAPDHRQPSRDHVQQGTIIYLHFALLIVFLCSIYVRVLKKRRMWLKYKDVTKPAEVRIHRIHLYLDFVFKISRIRICPVITTKTFCTN